MSFITACGDHKQEILELTATGKELSISSPEYAAVSFFDYIYNDSDLSRALPLCSEALQRTLKGYHSNRNVQRHVLNLSYDEVSMEVHSGQSRFENIVGRQSAVILYFSGTLHGDRVDDVRKVDLVQQGERWVIQRITPYPY